MLTVLISIGATAAAYRGVLAWTAKGTEGSMRARMFVILGGGPGPFHPK